MADKNQLPDWRDAKALARWLDNFPHELISAYSCRMGFLALSALGQLEAKDFSAKWAIAYLKLGFRSAAISWIASKRPSRGARDAASAVESAVDADFNAFTEGQLNAPYNLRVAEAGPRVACRAAIDTPDAVQIAARVTALAASAHRQKIDALIETSLDLMVQAKLRPNPCQWYLAQPIDEELYGADGPLMPFVAVLNSLPEADGWRLWSEWIQNRFSARPDWPDSVYDRLVNWRAEWNRPPEAVNRDIAAMLRAKTPETLAQTAAEAGGTLATWDFFLSFSNKDVETATAIDEILRAAGYRVFFQKREMDQSGSYFVMMNEGLARSSKLVAVLSPDYEASGHCMTEFGTFYDQDPMGNQGKIVQLLLWGPIKLPTAKIRIYRSIGGLTGEALKHEILRAIGHKG